jgi:riboflavin synthase
MFTGLIQTTGKVLAVESGEGSTRIRVEASGLALRTGDSIAVSGVCLTALNIEPGRFEADLAAETVSRTSLSRLAPGTTVNLELPTPAGTPLGGHVVQGHVDATGTLLSMQRVGTADWWLRVAVPRTLSRYMVEKGSIAIEGISLTIARWEPGSAEGDVVSVAIIPHTYAHTNLHTLEPGQPVNIEADVLIKYMEERASQGAKSSSPELTVAYLIANGY